MKIIMPPSGNNLKILGNPRPADNGLRWMTYVQPQPVKEGVLLFHTLTREMILLTQEEYDAPDNLPQLYEKWFRVPEDMVDQKYADSVRFIRKTMQKKSKYIKNYTVFTTTDCNARCFYCYEMGRSRINMSEETAHKTAAYIADHCGDKKVKLSWFGGEPLFNSQVIDIICEDLTEKGIEYGSFMISNSYLFDRETVQKAVDLWKLREIQVTLDGTEEVYNRSKAFVYRTGNPYQTVMRNIGLLLDAGIQVSVRMNIDNHNAEDLLALADELHERFAGKKNLTAYSHVLFEFSGNKEHVRTEENRHQLYRKQQILCEKLDSYHLMRKWGLRKKLKMNHCMADSDDSLTVLPGGELGLCEHYSEDNFVGHIDRKEMDMQMVQSFRECWEKTEECADCFCYPSCIRLKKCTEDRECFPEIREEHRRKLLDAMQITYSAWLKKEEAEEEEATEADC